MGKKGTSSTLPHREEVTRKNDQEQQGTGRGADRTKKRDEEKENSPRQEKVGYSTGKCGGGLNKGGKGCVWGLGCGFVLGGEGGGVWVGGGFLVFGLGGGGFFS